MSSTSTPRLWRTLALAGAAAGVAANAAQAELGYADPGHERIWLAAEGGEGGEGGAVSGDETVDFLKDLGLIEGHLRAGMELYRAGQGDMAATHMKHPGDEIYTELAERLEDFELSGFADELSALSAAVEGGASVEVAEAAFEVVLAKLGEARAASEASPHDRVEALEHMVLIAAEEYEIGVKDGAIVEMHEYQDAWGFVQAARAEAGVLAASDDETVSATARSVLTSLVETDTAFAGIVPEDGISGDSSKLYGAAARIEIAGLKLK